MTTIPASTRFTKIVLSSATAGPFNIDFRVVAADSLKVYVNGVVRSGWTMAPAVVDTFTDSATVTFTSALASGDVLVIEGALPLEREADLLIGDPGLVRKVNLEFGKVWAAVQEAAQGVSRALKTPHGSTQVAVFQPNNIVAMNALGTDFVGKTPASLLGTVGLTFGAASGVYPSLADMLNDTTIADGAIVGTLGYWTEFDGGSAFYLIKTNAAFGGTPDGMIDHQITGGLLVAVLQHSRVFDAQQCGVQAGVESSTAWNNAFARAASLAPTSATATEQPVTFICNIDVLTNKTLHMSRAPANAFTNGVRVIMEVQHPGAIIAVGGGDFESHLTAEMARLTTLHGSTVALGSALAAQFLKADPQVAVFLGDKIERPLPLINVVLTRSKVTLGDMACDFWCSGLRIYKCTATHFQGNMSVYNYRKYGALYTNNSNNDVKTTNLTAKQWFINDLTDHTGRMMAGGFGEPQNMTGDGIVSCQKDMMWFGGNTGWGRTAVVTLDQCGTASSDRWAGRTMYPDYFIRWNDAAWTDYGGAINLPQWDRMMPSNGTGDNDFYGMHVMQGYGETSDEGATFRQEGLAFGGQTGWENWNNTNAVNAYGSDIDSSITQLFGPAIRFYQPTITVGNTAKFACFHPVVRCYAARSTIARLTEFQNWAGSIGIFPFDRGVVGTPNVVSFSGDFTNWNYRNRVDSGSFTGPVTYRGQIAGGSGNLPSSSVVAAGDFFWVTEAGTYGGQAMTNGDILYARTTAPGTSYGANWYLGLNGNVPSLQLQQTVNVSKFVNVLVPHESNEPVIWYTKPAGNAALRLETGLTQFDLVFDGADAAITLPGKLSYSGDLTPAANGTQSFGATALRILKMWVNSIAIGTSTTTINAGSGTPEGVLTAPVGSTYHRTNGGAGTSFYVKESGTGNTGWIGK